jgi:hypothetical protein
MSEKIFGNTYDDRYSISQVGGGTTMIVLMVLCCCCSGLCGYSLRNKCTDKKSMVKWINDTWWLWIVSVVFPPLLILKMILWVMCGMVT